MSMGGAIMKPPGYSPSGQIGQSSANAWYGNGVATSLTATQGQIMNAIGSTATAIPQHITVEVVPMDDGYVVQMKRGPFSVIDTSAKLYGIDDIQAEVGRLMKLSKIKYGDK